MIEMTFKFKTEIWVPIYTGIKAENFQEFVEALKVIPSGSILYHLYINLFNYHNLPTVYPNSFAHWLASNGYKTLAEKLSVLDPTRYYDLESLREDLLKVLLEWEIERVKSPLRPFYFMDVYRKVFETGRVAHDLEQLIDGVSKSSIYSIFYHLITCRIDKGSLLNDYSEWLILQGYAKKAESIESIDIYLLNLYEIKGVILEVLKA